MPAKSDGWSTLSEIAMTMMMLLMMVMMMVVMMAVIMLKMTQIRMTMKKKMRTMVRHHPHHQHP